MGEPRLSGLVRQHVWITGHVQGVYFRESTRSEAERLGVRGWARNLPDGRVEAVFEGSQQAVAEMVEWCRTGPPSAKVDALEARDETPQAEPSFRVAR